MSHVTGVLTSVYEERSQEISGADIVVIRCILSEVMVTCGDTTELDDRRLSLAPCLVAFTTSEP